MSNCECHVCRKHKINNRKIPVVHNFPAAYDIEELCEKYAKEDWLLDMPEKMAIARHWFTPHELLISLSKEKHDEFVAYALLENPNVTLEMYENILKNLEPIGWNKNILEFVRKEYYKKRFAHATCVKNK